jgi:hypothetical protein
LAGIGNSCGLAWRRWSPDRVVLRQRGTGSHALDACENPSLTQCWRVAGFGRGSAYELYAHVRVAALRGLSDEKLSTIVAGQRPTDLTPQEAVAYDFASALVNGGVLPELTYRAAVEQFGANGAAELSYLVGLYCLVSVTLNTFDVPAPE